MRRPGAAVAGQPPRPGPPPRLPAGDGTVRVWQPAVGRMVRIVRHPAPVHAVGWSPDGTRLYTGGKDGAVRTVDADSDAILAERKATPGRVVSLAVSPRDGRVLVGDSQGATHVLEMNK